MFVKILKTKITGQCRFIAGREMELPDGVANVLIRRGIAREKPKARKKPVLPVRKSVAVEDGRT